MLDLKVGEAVIAVPYDSPDACLHCCLNNTEGEPDYCQGVPCSSDTREDGKDVMFMRVKWPGKIPVFESPFQV